MTDATSQPYDPIPDLGRLLCVAQRQGCPLPGLEFVLSRLMQGLALPQLAFSDEAEVAIREALAAHAAETAMPAGMTTTHEGRTIDARNNIPST